ncbi:Outer membrane protein TolC [Filimonas lacunae]|uniref:Outer membrane protein TolC n=2 Tax=Filimonas lacunae TaxID=477680 RepID=A0A1N7QQM6_9BACT|nr:Outer membrane protein TolC [Filimonas lacunae]
MHFMSKKLIAGFIPVVMLLPLLSGAQQAQPLPLQEALLLARRHSSQLKADSMQYSIAGTKVSQVSANALPQVSLNATYQRLSNNITPFSIALPTGTFVLNPQILNQSYNAVQLTQLLYGGGRVNNSRAAAKKEAAAAGADYAGSLLQLDQQVTDLWFNLYNARASEKIVLKNIEALSKKRDDLDAYREQGIVLANDVLKIELSVTSLRSSLADITSMAGTLNYNLCLATGLDPATIIDIPDNYLEEVSATEPLQTYVGAALAQRPELKGFQLRSEAAAYRVKAAKSDYLPVLNLIGSFNYDHPNQRIIPNVAHYDYSAFAGLNLSWKISALYANRSHVSESKLSALKLSGNWQQAKENIQGEVNSRYLEYRKTLDKMTLIKTELTQATENYRVEQNRLDAQTTTPTDFLDANARLLQAQLNLATAKANVQLAYHKLLQSTGTSTTTK